MNKITVRYEHDPALDHIDVVVRAAEKNTSVLALINNLAEQFSGSLAVSDQYGNPHMLPLNKIIRISVHGRRLEIMTADDCYYTTQTLQKLEKELNSEMFIRTSRYEIINLCKIRKYDFSTVGTLRLEMVGGSETWASRRCIPLIRKRLMGKEA